MSGYMAALLKNREAYEDFSGRRTAGIPAVRQTPDYLAKLPDEPESLTWPERMEYYGESVQTGILEDISETSYDYGKIESHINGFDYPEPDSGIREAGDDTALVYSLERRESLMPQDMN